MAKKVAQMIEEQVQFWRLKAESEHYLPKPEGRQPVITISREFGARGAALALNLQEKLGFKVWDKELLKVISERLNSNDEFIKALDENVRNPVEDAILGFMNRPNTNFNYMLYLVRAVRAIERSGNSIIVGRGANYICQKADSFHLRVVCPLKTRIENYAEREMIDLPEATKIVELKDRERATFMKKNFNRDINSPSDYDLVINSGSFSMDEMVDIVTQAYKRKTFKKALL
jgi:cytidylate kinase